MKNYVRPLKSFIAATLGRTVRLLARRSFTRRWLNVLYRALPYPQKREFHSRFAKLFVGRPERLEKSDWAVYFLEKKIIVPISGERSWLEWDIALSVLGHEAEIVETYETLLRSVARPAVFFDVGTNYGLHSALFLSQGIRTVSFEPNPDCTAFFANVCERNGWRPDVQQLALGDRQGSVSLCFPEREAWLGTVVPSVKKGLEGRADLKTIDVEMTTLDAFTERTHLRPDIIKIDTEGNEIHVLRGAMRTILKCRPTILFECFTGESRVALWDFFKESGYDIFALPVRSLNNMKALGCDGFKGNSASNFMAFPAPRTGASAEPSPKGTG